MSNFTTTICPTPDVLTRFCAGELEAGTAAHIQSHVQTCPNCLQLVATLAAASRRSTSIKDRQDTSEPKSGGPLPRVAIPPAMPTTIGRYQVLAVIGQGGMGTVYLAHDPQLGREVAIKVPRLDRGIDHVRFLQEARSLALLEHPHICPIYDVGEWEELPFLVMKYIRGQTLQDVLLKGRPATEQAVTWTLQLARVLAAAHAKDIIHRDLKPANVMLDEAGHLWLMDFGLSKLLDHSGGTESGVVLGTLGYMAPEQIDRARGAMGPATDVYSLGVIFYQLLSGKLPFSGTQSEMLAQTLQGSSAKLSTIHPRLSPHLVEICERAMHRDPAQRYANGAGFTKALSAIESHHLTPSVAGRVYRTSRLRPAAAVAGLALLLLGGFLLRAATSFSRPDSGAIPPALDEPLKGAAAIAPQRPALELVQPVSPRPSPAYIVAAAPVLPDWAEVERLVQSPGLPTPLRRAVVVGPRSPGMGPYYQSDASAMAEVLTQLGHDVALLQGDAARADRVKDVLALQQLGLTTNDLLVVSLHGRGEFTPVTSKGRGYRFYLNDGVALHEDELLAPFAATECRVLLLLDTNEAGGLKPALEQRNVSIELIAACAEGEQSFHSAERGHSIFTSLAIEYLSGRSEGTQFDQEGCPTLKGLAQYLYYEVPNVLSPASYSPGLSQNPVLANSGGTRVRDDMRLSDQRPNIVLRRLPAIEAPDWSSIPMGTSGP